MEQKWVATLKDTDWTAVLARQEEGRDSQEKLGAR